MIALDFMHRELKVGQKVVKIGVSSSTPRMELKTVTAIKDGEVYLNGWHSPVQYTKRLVIVEEAS